MFNRDQQDYCKYLDPIPPEHKCWCGWYKLNECPHCPPNKTAADKMKVWCPECHNTPIEGKIIHRIGCSKNREKRQSLISKLRAKG